MYELINELDNPPSEQPIPKPLKDLSPRGGQRLLREERMPITKESGRSHTTMEQYDRFAEVLGRKNLQNNKEDSPRQNEQT